MLEIKCFEFGPFGTNTYVVRDGKNLYVIDPACSNPYEQQMLYEYVNGQPSPLLIATHGHLDHLWGAAWATEQWHTPVLMHEADVPLAEAMQAQYDLFGIRATPQPFPIQAVGNGQFSAVSNRLSVVSCFHTPGHTPGSVCLYWQEEKTLFSGDTLFRGGYGRTDLPGGDTAQLFRSLRQLLSLPPDTLVYPGHGEPTTIGSESLVQVFLG